LRARAIARWLAKHNVMAASSIVTKAWGKSQPAAPNQRPDGSDDADGRAKNRRVEIFLVK
jgi:outer membrane protein OmpA-like peptidoglycan-associated protein